MGYGFVPCSAGWRKAAALQVGEGFGISRDAFNSIDRSAAAGNARARDLVSYFVGQGVGLIDSVKSAGAVVQEFKEDFVDAIEHMNALVAE